ncbi:hypothetical protein QQF64_018742 [Cirrhinus molitorella]|uniref:Uncharacterized protein n=1 Tax=Cirrhinus molitorella TaxID=172907 RepID=A0ABR3LG43_9TELE
MSSVEMNVFLLCQSECCTYQEHSGSALKRVKQMQADMGGTEILQPLKHIYSQPCYPNHPRQLFIFTDGEVETLKRCWTW